MRSKKTISCGCYNKNKNLTHGMTKKNKNCLLYRVWRDMKARCYNKRQKKLYVIWRTRNKSL